MNALTPMLRSLTDATGSSASSSQYFALNFHKRDKVRFVLGSLDKLKSVDQTFDELTRRMADPDVAKDPDEFQKIAKARASP